MLLAKGKNIQTKVDELAEAILPITKQNTSSGNTKGKLNVLN